MNRQEAVAYELRARREVLITHWIAIQYRRPSSILILIIRELIDTHLRRSPWEQIATRGRNLLPRSGRGGEQRKPSVCCSAMPSDTSTTGWCERPG
jgi:hypothetical protein